MTGPRKRAPPSSQQQPSGTLPLLHSTRGRGSLKPQELAQDPRTPASPGHSGEVPSPGTSFWCRMPQELSTGPAKRKPTPAGDTQAARKAPLSAARADLTEPRPAKHAAGPGRRGPGRRGPHRPDRRPWQLCHISCACWWLIGFFWVNSRDAWHCLRRKLKKLDMALLNKYFKAS